VADAKAEGNGGGAAAPAPTGHSRFGASKSDRWLACTASVKAEAAFPNRETPEAKEGTALHAVSALCLTNGQDAIEYVDRVVDGIEIDDDHAAAVQVFIDTIRGDKEARGGKLLVETRFHLDFLHPEFFGTADCVRLGTDNILSVYDAKFGRGVIVEVLKGNRPNPQLAYYGLGAIEQLKRLVKNLNVEKVELVVVQPRAQHADGPVRRVMVTHSELLDLCQDLVEAATEAESEDAKFKAGNHCRFCLAAGSCKTLRDFAMESAQLDFDDEEGMTTKQPYPNPLMLEGDELARALAAVPTVKAWISALEVHALMCAKGGIPVPGYKLVERKTHRRWKNADEAAGELSLVFGLDDSSIFKQKIVTPAQAEKLLPKEDRPKLAPLIEKPEGAQTLVPANDARSEQAPSAQTDFDD
jgi:Protein of unknown function (DUF2800)